MSNKRFAANELNADNWDQADEPEEIGTFQVASQEELEKRVVRTAKRRSNLISSDEPKKGVFSNFGGFGKSASTSSASPFSFLSNLANGKTELNKPAELKSLVQKDTPKVTENVKIEEKITTGVSHTDEYCANLKNLNQGVCEWIKSHIEKNPYCILTPIFDDYRKHLKDLDKYKTEPIAKIHENVNSNKSDKWESKPTDIFSIQNKDSSSSTSLFPVTEKFQKSIPDTPKSGEKLDTSKFNNPNNNMFSQGFSSTPISKAPMFSFGQKSSVIPTTASNFTFGNIPQGEKRNEPKPDDENEEDEEPPKATFTPVVEEDSVYSKRCKVFVKNEVSFGDRGVGTLYLKPIAGSEKYQLIVRADTSLGNLLLNMVLSASIPTKRMGKNNVMLVTIPTPDAKPPPVPLLLRVKTSEEADELLATLDKYKK